MRQKLKMIALFWGPSINGGVLTVVLAVIVLSVANFSYLLRSGLIYDFLFGKGTPYDLIQSSQNTVSTLNQTILGNPLLNKVLFFVFWLLIGLGVYAFIATFSQSIAETSGELERLHYVHAHKAQIEQNILLRIAMRIMGVLGIFLVGWLVISFLLPFGIYTSRIWLGSLTQITGWLYLILSLATMIVAIHAFVIVMRLAVLRPRLFGGWDNLN